MDTMDVDTEDYDADEQEEDKYFSCTSPKVEEGGYELSVETLQYPKIPDKSKEIYERCYRKLMTWCKAKNQPTDISENLLVMYFNELTETFKAPTLGSIYSMLKVMILHKHSLDISDYRRLLTILKNANDNYVPNSRPPKSLALTREQVIRFFKEANDDRYLMIKVALIFGICGGCRIMELYNIKEENIKVIDDKMLTVTVTDPKTHVPRMFPVINDEVDYIATYKKYASLRTGKPLAKKGFFIKYTNKRCYNQIVGTNTLGKIPLIVAKFLKLEKPELYTGHCFRRTSKIWGIRVEDTSSFVPAAAPSSAVVAATNVEEETRPENNCYVRLSIKQLLADAEADVNKRQLKFDFIAEGCIEYPSGMEMMEESDPLENVYIKQEPHEPSTSADSSPSHSPSHVPLNQMKDISMRKREIHLSNCTNVTININIRNKIN